MLVDKFKEALEYFNSIEGFKENNNPFSPMEKYSSLSIHHHYNEYADFPVIHFDLNQMFRMTGSILYEEIAGANDVAGVCELRVDRKAKDIYSMMKLTGDVYGKYFK